MDKGILRMLYCAFSAHLLGWLGFDAILWRRASLVDKSEPARLPG